MLGGLPPRSSKHRRSCSPGVAQPSLRVMRLQETLVPRCEAGAGRTQARWYPIHGYQRDQPSLLLAPALLLRGGEGGEFLNPTILPYLTAEVISTAKLRWSRPRGGDHLKRRVRVSFMASIRNRLQAIKRKLDACLVFLQMATTHDDFVYSLTNKSARWLTALKAAQRVTNRATSVSRETGESREQVSPEQAPIGTNPDQQK